MGLSQAFISSPPDAADLSKTPPFSIHQEDAVSLQTCSAFRSIRGLLQLQHNDTFCMHHRPTSEEHIESWLLQRDITYALIFPLLRIFQHAAELALSQLEGRNVYDLELVFRGEGRSAFAWLQAFFAEEEEWCKAAGCPGCVVSHILRAEPTIRIILTACRLASVLRVTSDGSDFPPAFDFWSSSLRAALAKDRFWGPSFWGDLEPRAANLENGIQQMVRQCMEFESMGPSGKGFRRSRCGASMQQPTGAPMRLGTYRMDGSRLVFVSEESSWMQKVVAGCWSTPLTDAVNVGYSPCEPRASASLMSVQS